ncbi:hypothetical protein APR04_001722 [Promicromonospora umidemergens]|uniref:Uncharacterized protein n=1 Tax=Promicromonospora umidemergens TaxID=629679 RepID=A0ABP8XEL7_9MICO|nr:hypothetical protein [Promicromonospora umidemergens]MCP2282819.1 hypothetical protein [Promicromonospora umidemergens]
MPTTNTSNQMDPDLVGPGPRGALTLARYWVARHRVLSLAIVLLGAIALVAALRFLTPDPADHQPVVVPSPTAAPSADTHLDVTNAPTLPPDVPLAQASNPDAFARAVAETVFTWDTSSTTLPDVTEQFLVVADPTGEETPGLLVDLRTYLPNDQAWTHLVQYRTRQWIEITGVVEPVAWDRAVAQAPEGALTAGTTARTVTGVRHRAGLWEDEPASASSPVQFTVFLVCSPSDDQCHVLRLSTPGLALH